MASNKIMLTHLFHPSAVDELVQVKRCSAVRTLTPLFSQPPPDAQVAAQLRAVRAEVRVPELQKKLNLFYISFNYLDLKLGNPKLLNHCKRVHG